MDAKLANPGNSSGAIKLLGPQSGFVGLAARSLAELLLRVTSAEQAILGSATIAQLAGKVEPLSRGVAPG
jgi:hypothetical protein